jgi:ABC-2 type transport system ATP-binding protein
MGPGLNEAVLALANVGKRYGKVTALSGLNLNVHPGQVYGLLGRNGAGKSTSLRIVMGITRPDSGSVVLFGRPTKPGDVSPRRSVGYVAQEQHFYEWMTPDRLGRFVGAFYPTWDRARFNELLRRFDVPARKVRTFSGGTKVKLGLALALAHRPKLLVLDEPTAGLDAVARREFLEIVREQASIGEQTTLFSSHLIDDVEWVSSQVGVIDGGRMLYEGPLVALTERVRNVLFHGEQEVSALAGLELRVLARREVGGGHLVTLWSEHPDAFGLLEQRAGQPLARVPLEEIFIALVRREASGYGA